VFEPLKAEAAEIIVIDPKKTASAELERSRWIPIRPGSDGALALGLAHILIREPCYDHDVVYRWTVGFDEFAAYVTAKAINFHPLWAIIE
jgi:anaerobic selenocysteine-containing dehydrogenase